MEISLIKPNWNWNKVVVLTGAGISQESGLQTFRGADGLWEGHRVEEVATPEAFQSNPELVQKFYNLRRKQLFEVEPNPAHMALAEFEKKFEGSFTLITQNVDDLHERAGSQNILHMHGELRKVRHLDTGEASYFEGQLDVSERLRPDIVWFGEMPLYMDQIQDVLTDCDLFVAIGTSGLVYPASGLVGWTPESCHKVEINLENTSVSPSFDEKIHGPAGQKVPEFFSL